MKTITFESLVAGQSVALPYELTLSLKPGYGEYVTEPGVFGEGITLTIRRGSEVRSDHYPNRLQAWQRASALQGRVAS